MERPIDVSGKCSELSESRKYKNNDLKININQMILVLLLFQKDIPKFRCIQSFHIKSSADKLRSKLASLVSTSQSSMYARMFECKYNFILRKNKRDVHISAEFQISSETTKPFYANARHIGAETNGN